MNWHPILVGLDGSLESARAAKIGAHIAQRAGVACRLLHTVASYGPIMSVEGGISIAALDDAALTAGRRLVDLSLEGVVSDTLRREVEVRLGRAPSELAAEAVRLNAEVVILGGKNRRGFARVGGSTVTHLVRLGAVPVLAVHERAGSIRRILVAVDLSWAAKPAIDAAERWAELFGAELRVIHSTEPLPVIPGFSIPTDDDAHYEQTRSAVESAIQPLLASTATEIVIRRGRSAAAITSEAERWNADLVVMGSHGKGWADRLLIGSTSERLIRVLPTSLLIVPVVNPGALRTDGVHAGNAGTAWQGTERRHTFSVDALPVPNS